MSNTIILRKQAVLLNLAKYYTGVPCKHGHICERITSSRKCVTCIEKYSKNGYHQSYYNLNKDYLKSKSLNRYVENKEQIKLVHKKYYEKNKTKILSQRKPYIKEYQEKNSDKLNCKTAYRRALKLRATPKWADKTIISKFYKLAFDKSISTGVQHHVHHIVPLNSPIVCGLHNEFNLAVITAEENLRIGNRWWPDMPE